MGGGEKGGSFAIARFQEGLPPPPLRIPGAGGCTDSRKLERSDEVSGKSKLILKNSLLKLVPSCLLALAGCLAAGWMNNSPSSGNLGYQLPAVNFCRSPSPSSCGDIENAITTAINRCRGRRGLSLILLEPWQAVSLETPGSQYVPMVPLALWDRRSPPHARPKIVS